MLAGSGRAALRALMATLIMTARLNYIDPKAWLVLARIADARQSRLHECCPGTGRLPRRQSPNYANVNEVYSVTTICRLAKNLGEDENGLGDVANGMDLEDGLIWVRSR